MEIGIPISAVGYLESDINALLESGDTQSVQGYWPNLIMYPTHYPSMLGETPEKYLSICGKITGTYRESTLGASNSKLRRIRLART